jgi:hypothetical protein
VRRPRRGSLHAWLGTSAGSCDTSASGLELLPCTTTATSSPACRQFRIAINPAASLHFLPEKWIRRPHHVPPSTLVTIFSGAPPAGR